MFKKPLPLKVLTVIYPHMDHVVALDGKGIRKFADLKGKKISAGRARQRDKSSP